MGKKSLVLNIVKNLRMRIKMILSISFLSIAIVWILNSFFIVPEYEAVTQIFIEESSLATQTTNAPAIDAIPSISDTYSAIVRSPEILKEVIVGMELEMTISELRDQVNVSKTENSQVLNIRVAGNDKNEAAAIANALAVVFVKEIPNLTQTTGATIISSASDGPESTLFEENVIFSLGVAGAFGLIVGTLFAFILELLNTVIKTGKQERRTSSSSFQTVFK